MYVKRRGIENCITALADKAANEQTKQNKVNSEAQRSERLEYALVHRHRRHPPSPRTGLL